MPNLPNKDECCACGACIDACPKNAIKLSEDKNQFYCIEIDKDKCVECKLCEKKCHLLNICKHVFNTPKATKPLAGWSTNTDIIKNSASGGIFAQLAVDFLDEPNSYVYGATLLENSSVKHIEISHKEDVYKLQNSKYQQSNACGIYSKVKNRLSQGCRVLFSGTPCQVGALKCYLGEKTDTANLYTIEVVCHGVPSNAIHRLALKREKAKRVVSYRNKREKGWIFGANNRVVYELNDGTRKEIPTLMKDYLFRSYLTMSFIRKNCYNCRYARLERVSDLTIGDFWGFEKSHDFEHYGNFMGTSIILPNTPKGKFLLQSSNNLRLIDTQWRDILLQNQNLYMPTNRYVFKGGDYINVLVHMPSFITTFIIMNGNTNKLLDKLYTIILGLLQKKKFKHQNTEMRHLYDETVALLEK